MLNAGRPWRRISLWSRGLIQKLRWREVVCSKTFLKRRNDVHTSRLLTSSNDDNVRKLLNTNRRMSVRFWHIWHPKTYCSRDCDQRLHHDNALAHTVFLVVISYVAKAKTSMVPRTWLPPTFFCFHALKQCFPTSGPRTTDDPWACYRWSVTKKICLFISIFLNLIFA